MKPAYDEEIEHRITMEILVDTYDDEDEEFMGWYYYLQNNINVPFQAKIDNGEICEVLELAAQEDCSLHEMWVIVRIFDDELSVSLENLSPIDADEETLLAIGDWQYWLAHYG